MPRFHKFSVYTVQANTSLVKIIDEKDTIAIRAGKAKVVEKLNSFRSIWVVWIRLSHLRVQFKLYKR